MARRDFLTRNRSIYTISKKHQTTTEGTIYEKDHITIIPDDGIYDERPLFSDSNFKFKIGFDKNGKKRHVRGAWVKPNEEESGETWTLANLSGHSISEESRILNKPNYSSLKDFAYYGSAVELIKATVNDVIMRFPGGLSYYGSSAPQVDIDGTTYYLVSNEFQIDFWTQGDVFSGDVKNPMRILAASYSNYVDRNGNVLAKPVVEITGDCLDTIIGTAEIGGDSFYIFLKGDGEKCLLTTRDSSNFSINEKLIIRPKEEIINSFWETLDDFERVVLNRDTTPVYTAVFETPFSTDEGFFYDMRTYAWPTVGDDGFTPDITSANYQGYITALIDLASFHDEYDSDNVWRMLVHESMKNLDWTFYKNNGDEGLEDLSDIDSSRVQSMVRVCGRQFDDIKLYAENVKSSNAVSYDEKNNVPDYFLTDKAECEGWDALSIAPTNDSEITSDPVSGEVSGSTWVFEKGDKTASDVNINFVRRLVLSSNYINVVKGTRRGINALLGLFGYEDVSNIVGSGNTSVAGEYNIKEYVAVAHNFPDYEDISRLRGKGDYVNYDTNVNYMKGYPVAVISPSAPSGATYIVPWYDDNESYDDPFYFQEKGGWGKVNKKSINLSITSYKEIEETDDVKIYGETESYMKYASTIKDMLNIPNNELNDEMVCYVADISDLENGYNTSPADAEYENSAEDRMKLYSHYFILKNKTLSPYVGFVSTDVYNCYGWRNIYNAEFDGTGTLSTDGLRVLYLESLESTFDGNNPHIGNGEYDDGASYIKRYNFIFEEAVKRGIFDYLKDSKDEDDKNDYKAILTSGFCVSFIAPSNEDDKKCHYFQDTEAESNLQCLEKEGDSAWTETTDTSKENWNEDFYNNLSIPPQEMTINSKHDEAAANSVVNVKNIRINFGIGGNTFLREYIEKVVVKYLATVIPSTAILSYTFDGEELLDNTVFELAGAETLNTMEVNGLFTDENDTLFIDNEYFENNMSS